MSDAFLLRRGGGFPIGGALLHVTAPVGSTLTFETGGVTVKTLGPGRAHTKAADSDMADYYCPVGSGSYGTWTVTATLDSDSASDSVTISANRQYDMVLTYDLYFVRNGVVMNGRSAAHNVPSGGTVQASISAEEGYTRFLVSLNGQSSNAYGYSVYFTPNVDLSGWRTLVLDCRYLSAYQNYGGAVRAPIFGLSAATAPTNPGVGPTLDYSVQKTIAAASASTLTERASFLLDVTGCTGQLYAAANIMGSASVQEPEMRIVNFYLTKDVIEGGEGT